MVILSWGLFSAAAHAGSLSLVGLQDTSQINAQGTTITSESGTGEGILFSGHLTEGIALETGALYFEHKWGDNTSGTNVITSQVLQVPLVFQMRVFRFFYIGAGGYYTANVGDLKETGSTTNSSLGYTAYGIKNNDYGWVGDAGLQFHVLGRMFLRLEARYTSGSTNLALTSGNQFYTRDWQYIAGLTFYFGGGGGGKESDIGSRR
jgi:outer membrane protein W